MKHMHLTAVAAALLLAVSTGCGDRDRTVVASNDELAAPSSSSDSDWGPGDLLALVGAKLTLSTDDPEQVYVRDDKDPWISRSLLTRATSFNLTVTNEGSRATTGVELLVAIPANLPQNGWSVTIGDPGVLLSHPSDFPCRRLEQSTYPDLPHGVYAPHGQARYIRIPGPVQLKPGESWVVPVQLFRGEVKNFKVHFDAGSRRFWSAPTNDVTAVPPIEENFAPR